MTIITMPQASSHRPQTADHTSHNGGISMTSRRILMLALIAVCVMGAGVGAAAAITTEYNGENVTITGAQPNSIIWNAFNFEGLNYGFNSQSSETLTIAPHTLLGPNVDRTIDAGNLAYNSTAKAQTFGYADFGTYNVIGFVAQPYFAGYLDVSDQIESSTRTVLDGMSILGNGNLSKILIDSDDKYTITTGSGLKLKEGYVLNVQQLDLGGDKAWFELTKNGKVVDTAIVYPRTGTGDDYYIYDDLDIGNKTDVPVIIARVDDVFGGTDTNVVTIEGLFQISDNAIPVGTGDLYGAMEITSVDSTSITMRNYNESILLERNSTKPIIGNITFQVADNDIISFFPSVDITNNTANNSPVYTDYCCVWNLSEGYAFAFSQVAMNGHKALFFLLKNGEIIDQEILTEESSTGVYSDFHYRYVINETEIINATLKSAFLGTESKTAKLEKVNQHSETNGNLLLLNGSHTFKSEDPAGISWNLSGEYALTMKDIGIEGEEVWFELSKDEKILSEKIVKAGDDFIYANGSESFNCTVTGVMRGTSVKIIKINNVNLYSDAGIQLFYNESHTYASGNPTGETWNLAEGYSLNPRDIDLNGNQVWLSLEKDGNMMKDEIISAPEWFNYYNSTGVLIFSTYVDAVFRGTDDNLITVANTKQYSKINGSLIFEQSSKIIRCTGTPVVETIKPILHITYPSNGITVSTFSIEIGGTAEAYSGIAQIRVNGILTPFEMNISSGLSTWAKTISLTSGTNTIRVYAMDNGGNSTTKTLYVTYTQPVSEPYEIRGKVARPTDIGDAFSHNTDIVWNASTFSGFYYNLDDGTGTENLNIIHHVANSNEDITDLSAMGEDNRTIYENHLVYSTSSQSTDFEYKGFGSYSVIGFLAEPYFTGYDAGGLANDVKNATMAGNALDNLNLLSGDNLSRVLIDSDDKYTLATGDGLNLKEGYALNIRQVDIQGNKALIELTKYGEVVDTEVVYPGTTDTGDVYVYDELDFGNQGNVPIIIARVDTVFRGTETSVVIIEGLFQISDILTTIKTGDTYGELEVSNKTATTIQMVNNNTNITLSKGSIKSITNNFKFRVADSNDFRFYPFMEINKPGTYEIRGSVARQSNIAGTIWNYDSFAGFYYDLDNDVGSETLAISETQNHLDTGASRDISIAALEYHTTAQTKGFGHREFGTYNVIGFLAKPYFTGYVDVSSSIENNTKKITDARSILVNGTISKILIDSDDKYTIATGNGLELKEGYVLNVQKVDLGGNKALLELTKDGKVIDTEVVYPGHDGVYVYDEGPLGHEANYPLIIARVEAVFRGTDTNVVTIEGLFQISDTITSVEAGDEFGEMEVTDVNSSAITMKNINIVPLSLDSVQSVAGSIKLRVADDVTTLRFYPFVDATVEEVYDVITPHVIVCSRVPLTVGWNLVALTGTPANTSAASVMSSVADNITVVWGYNKNAVPQWELYDPRMPPALNSLRDIMPGKGYWIYANADVEWVA